MSLNKNVNGPSRPSIRQITPFYLLRKLPVSITGKFGTHVDPQHIKAYIARVTARRTPNKTFSLDSSISHKRSKQEENAEHGDESFDPWRVGRD